jgi:hypothetical protein
MLKDRPEQPQSLHRRPRTHRLRLRRPPAKRVRAWARSRRFCGPRICDRFASRTGSCWAGVKGPRRVGRGGSGRRHSRPRTAPTRLGSMRGCTAWRATRRTPPTGIAVQGRRSPRVTPTPTARPSRGHSPHAERGDGRREARPPRHCGGRPARRHAVRVEVLAEPSPCRLRPNARWRAARKPCGTGPAVHAIPRRWCRMRPAPCCATRTAGSSASSAAAPVA